MLANHSFQLILDSNINSTNNLSIEWLNQIIPRFQNAQVIRITSDVQINTGPILSEFFTNNPNVLANCTELYCTNNQLTELPFLNNCNYLDCSDNSLNILPNLPMCEELDCNQNELTALPELANCVTINCVDNRLGNFFEINRDYTLNNCINLYCNSNQLPVRGQEQVLRDGGYPEVNKMPDNFWGLKPPL